MGSILGVPKGQAAFLNRFQQLEVDYQNAQQRLKNACPLWRYLLFRLSLVLKKPYTRWIDKHYYEYH